MTELLTDKEITRIEQDSMGEVLIPQTALYGAQTGRAVMNFPISGLTMPQIFVQSVALIKSAAAQANLQLGKISPEIQTAISDAALEIMEGKHEGEFPVDVFQTGSGTSTNMNVNEVIATRANQLLGFANSGRDPVHPNNHVNLGQSSNDVIPTALHISTLLEIRDQLLPALDLTQSMLQEKSEEFSDVVKIGRTHLQDATPITLGQEFSGYASMLSFHRQQIENCFEQLRELALGGTAVGTGINTHHQFASLTIQIINEQTWDSFVESSDHFRSQGFMGAIVETSGALKNLAVSLLKISNDIRWLASGPNCSIGEINLPELQPGSSIMPGKVNPVLAESLCQIAAQVMGNDHVVSIAGMSGNFELNVMLPVMAHNILQSIQLLASGMTVFSNQCLQGITANVERCSSLIEGSLALCTPLAKTIGYDQAAKIAKEAQNSGRTIREIVREKQLMSEEELSKLLDPRTMLSPE